MVTGGCDGAGWAGLGFVHPFFKNQSKGEKYSNKGRLES